MEGRQAQIMAMVISRMDQVEGIMLSPGLMRLV
jgi:hypothetical protein